MMPAVVLKLLCTLTILCNLQPIPEPWEPDPTDVELVAKTVWGEFRGDDAEQRAAVVLCICNRVDDPRFPDTIEAVVTQPCQFQGYSPNNPTTFADEVRELLIQWHNGDSWLDSSLCWFYGDGKINHYRNAWKQSEADKFWP